MYVIRYQILTKTYTYDNIIIEHITKNARGEVKKLKNNLKKILKEKGISGMQLSRITGISTSVIYSISSEKIVAFPGWKRRISEALGVPVDEIFPNEEV